MEFQSLRYSGNPTDLRRYSLVLGLQLDKADNQWHYYIYLDCLRRRSNSHHHTYRGLPMGHWNHSLPWPA